LLAKEVQHSRLVHVHATTTARKWPELATLPHVRSWWIPVKVEGLSLKTADREVQRLDIKAQPTGHLSERSVN